MKSRAFLTPAQDGISQIHTPAHSAAGEDPPVTFGYEIHCNKKRSGRCDEDIF